MSSLHNNLATSEACASDTHNGRDAPSEGDALTDLLTRWLGLSETQQRALQALGNEINIASALVEKSTEDISSRFQRLAENAGSQTERVRDLADASQEVEVDDEMIPLSEVIETIDTHLFQVISKILETSKHGVSVVFALDDVIRDVQTVEDMIAEIEAINKKTNLLAMNAMIEAARAGEADMGFNVVAQEVRTLSSSVNTLAERMRSEITRVADGVRSGHKRIREVANIDMSENILMKDRISDLMTGVVAQNAKFNEALTSSGQLSEEIGRDIAGLITGLQFQDRTKQRLESVIDTFDIMRQAANTLSEETRDKTGISAEAFDEAWICGLIDEMKLGEMRQRFVSTALLGLSPDDAEAEGRRDDKVEFSKASEDVELFEDDDIELF